MEGNSKYTTALDIYLYRMIYMADRKCATADTGSEHSVCNYESMRILFMNFLE